MALDASTAILLAKLDLLRMIAQQGHLVMAPTPLAEATTKESDDARMIARLVEENIILKKTIKEKPDQIMRDFRLDRGEAETILLARQEGAISATDDGPAIRCCRVLGIPFTSAVGLLAILAERGWLEPRRALALLEKLQEFGRYGARIIEDVTDRIKAAKGGGKEAE